MSGNAPFQIVHASLVLSVPPVFATNPRIGVEEMLDSMIMRYIPSLQGVVLSHSKLSFIDNVASIQRDCPFLVCKVAFDATVWSPRVGLNLSGKVNLCSPDHISLLVHRTFNVSIPRHHIPTDIWEFEYGPAENDPEYGHTVEERTAANFESDSDVQKNTGGRWVHKTTGQILGGEGVLDFTVIGLTVANEMLSLLGSLQHDPFSQRHSQKKLVTGAEEVRREDNYENPESEDDKDDLVSEPNSEDESDTFPSLGKRKDLHDQVQEMKKKRRV